MPSVYLSGLSYRFQQLSRSLWAGCLRITHPFATKMSEDIFVRLACIRHAASVHPEPGSNSPFDCSLWHWLLCQFLSFFYLNWRSLFNFCSVFKDHFFSHLFARCCIIIPNSFAFVNIFFYVFFSSSFQYYFFSSAYFSQPIYNITIIYFLQYLFLNFFKI